MPTIRIDDELYEFLKDRAEPFVDSPNTVLRRLVGLPTRNGSETIDESPPDDATRAAPASTGTRATRQRGRSSVAKRARSRAEKGTLLPESEYELPILEVLVDRGGRAPASEVLDALEPRLDGKLTAIDRERLSSGGVRWRNRAQFVRLALVKKDEMASDSPRGIWELTEAGRRRAEGR